MALNDLSLPATVNRKKALIDPHPSLSRERGRVREGAGKRR
jgi:hypothetical protein